MLDGERRAAAFAPAHITGFFEIRDEAREVEKRGSRGAGFSVRFGARSVATVEPADAFALDVRVNRAPDAAPVTAAAVRKVLAAAAADGKLTVDRDAPRDARWKAHVRIDTDLDLPVGQGFGMSAAGALSASLALARALRAGRVEAVKAAHAADVESRTGLGDVIGASQGGFEIRAKPGLPPWGALQSFVGHEECVLCVVGDALPTKTVLTDRKKRAQVNAAGARAVDALLGEPTMEHFLALSHRFADECGLMTDEVREAVEACRTEGHASMVMLGNSVFAFGRTARLEEILRDFGETWVAAIDTGGARLLEIETAR